MKKIVMLAVALLCATGTAQAADILLGDVVAGGDGSGNAPAGNIGINADTGEFGQAHLFGYTNTGDSLVEVAASELVDSVFIITTATNPITSTGVTFDFDVDDVIVVDDTVDPPIVGTCYDLILNSQNPEGVALTMNNVVYTSGAMVHSSAGVTFDLAALRGVHGAAAVKTFSAVIGGDFCGALNVDLHVIVSDAGKVLSSVDWHATTNRARFVQFAIPDEARFLTLATGSNGVDACDHGIFAEARITAAPIDGTLASLAFDRPPIVIAGGAATPLRLIGEMNTYGARLTLEEVATGTTYTVSDPAILDVDANGVLTGKQLGTASVTATNSGKQATAIFVIGVDLGGIAAGGNGLANPPPAGNVGIDEDTGAFVTAQLNGVVNQTGNNPQAPVGFPLIDSVFMMTTDSLAIHTGGLTYDFGAGEGWGNSWDYILNGREPGGPAYLNMGTGGTFYSGLGIHASAGITYNLEELGRVYPPAKLKYFFAIAGEAAGQGGGGPVDAFVVASTASEVLGEWSVRGKRDSGEVMNVEIPAGTKFLTLAIGAAGNGIGGDHGAFAQAVIVDQAIDLSYASIAVSPTFVTLRAGDTIQFRVNGTTKLGGFTVDVTGQAAYQSSNAQVASVDAAGLATMVANGQATITVAFETLTATVPVLVTDFIDLGEIAAGGDGTAANPPTYIGIDPDTGLFGTAEVFANMLPTGDNPEAVDAAAQGLAYDLIDSVFILAADTQAINVPGDTFDFLPGDSHTNGWDLLLNAQETDSPIVRPYVGLGGLGHTVRGLGVHAAAGITYDLGAIRTEHGAGNVNFVSAYAGEGSAQPTGTVDCYIILTDGTGTVIASATKGPFTDSSEFVELEIAAAAKYLTFAVGDANNGVGSDHGVFGNAFITKCSFLDPTNCGEVTTEVRVFMGNANGDTTVNIADAVTILGYLFGKPPKPVIPCFKAADTNDDNTLNVADAIDVLTFLFGAQTNPSKPMTGPDGSAISAAACRPYPAADIPATIIGQPGCVTQCP